MLTSGSMIGISPRPVICAAYSNCWSTMALMPSWFGSWMNERILVPKMPFSTARSNNESSFVMGFISCTPLSTSLSP